MIKEYIITLTRNIGIGKDIVNYFEKRGCEVVFKDAETFPKTIIISTMNHIEDIRRMEYVGDVIEARQSRLIV